MRYSLIALAATSLLSSASARGHAHRRHAHPQPELPVPAVVNDDCVCSTYVTTYLVDYTAAPAPPTTTTVQTMTIMPIHETGAPSSEETLPSPVDLSSAEDITPTVVPSSPEEIDATSSVALSSVDDVAPTVVPSSTEEITTTYSSTVTSTYLSTDTVTVTAHSSAPIVPSLPATVPTPAVTVIETPGTYTIPATTITLTKTEAVCVPETTSLAPGTQTYGGVTTIVATSTTVICPLATVTVEDGVTTSKVYTTTYICPSAGTYIIGATTSTVTGTVTVPCEYPVPTAYPPGTYIQPEVVTTITVTSQVVTCPLFTAGPTAGPSPTDIIAVPTSAPAPISAAPVSSAAPAPASSVVATVIPSASSAAPPPPAQSPPVSAGSGPWAITYSPYANGGGCKSASAIDADIADIAAKGFGHVRLYATDCDGLKNVGGSAEKYGLGLIMGIFIKAGGVSTGDSQVQDLIAWNKWNMIVMFVIGNESIFNGYCSASELAAYIVSVTAKVRSAGYTGLITTTEPLNIIQASSGALCSAIDVVGVNIHPYFNSGVTAEKAGEFLAGQLQLAEAACPGKEGWVLEAGWPSAGAANGVAIPGKSEQAVAIASILKAVPGKVTMFTYTDDLWKSAGAFGVEQSFGCGGLF